MMIQLQLKYWEYTVISGNMELLKEKLYPKQIHGRNPNVYCEERSIG
jgi:hypothetical protein